MTSNAFTRECQDHSDHKGRSLNIMSIFQLTSPR